MSKVILLLLIMTIYIHLSLSQGVSCSNSSFKEVVFVIDTSNSIGGQNKFQLIRDFTANIATDLINSSRSAVGVILFSTTPHIEFNLKAHTNLSALKSAINNLNFSQGNPTSIPKALRLLSSTAQNGELGFRKDSSKIAIVITDGQPKNMPEVLSAAKELHSLILFDIYVVGIGTKHESQLKEIASRLEFFFLINNVTNDDLQPLIVEILNKICTEPKVDSGLCNNQPLQIKDDTSCFKCDYKSITDLINKSCKADFLSELILALENITANLVNLTDPRNANSSVCPADLMKIVLLLEFIVNTTKSYPGVLSSQEIIQNTIDVFSNILNPVYNLGWMELQKRDPPFNQRLLLQSERYGLILAENFNEDRVFESANVSIATKRVNSSSTDVSRNGTSIGLNNNSISIPAEFIQERFNITGKTSIPIVTIHYKNIQNILPISTANSAPRFQPVSQVLSSQVTNISDTSSDSAINLTLQYSLNSSVDLTPRCGFWNFSLNDESGGWDTRGVQIITNDRNNSIITCNSSHLTSFAVLVDISGGHKEFSDHERMALSIISYIGCIISLFCLLIAIILLIYYRNTLLKGIHNFIHLNLAIALFLALIVFVSGIETATASEIGCTIVAALLHYFFTAVFTWMLCEGIMIYFHLVKIFNTGLGQRRLFYFALGWGIPVPIVAISAGVAHDQYGHDDFCWINYEEGAICAFVGPMIVIIILNVLFLLLALRSLCMIKRSKLKGKESYQAALFVRAILKATVILLPLLGITWVFGLLAVNQESSVFAWIFTILNSLQGLLILVFHVIRNEKIWHKISSSWKDNRFSFIIPSSQRSPIDSRSTTIKKSIRTTSHADIKQDTTVDTKQRVAINIKREEEAVSSTNSSMDITVPTSNNKTEN